ncbi:MAG: cytochrome c-type biogenesis protein CcmH [Methylomonas sp.]|nr:cytochrome c-type biogenesis protein CcmH [Methylomonas sp.]
MRNIPFASFPRSAWERLLNRSAVRDAGAPGNCFPRRAWEAWLILCLALLSAPLPAVVEYHPFDDPAREKAYQTLISELRCLVCQNQTIADSNADLAKDLRQQVYDMLQQGKSEQDVVDFMTQRYGDFVMYNPALNVKTALLWLGPVAFLAIGIIAVVILARSRTKPVLPTLDKSQQSRLNDILQKGEED